MQLGGPNLLVLQQTASCCMLLVCETAAWCSFPDQSVLACVLTSLPIQFSTKESAHQQMFLPAEIPKVAFQMQQSFQAACQEALGDLLTLVEQHVAIETKAGQGSPAALAQFFAIKLRRSSTMPFISTKRASFPSQLVSGPEQPTAAPGKAAGCTHTSLLVWTTLHLVDGINIGTQPVRCVTPWARV